MCVFRVCVLSVPGLQNGDGDDGDNDGCEEGKITQPMM